jgi:hypothetical protein
MGEESDIEFRPSPALRIGLAFVAFACGIPAAGIAVSLLGFWDASFAVALCILLVPVSFAFTINRTLVRLGEFAITSRRSLSSRRVPYSEIRWVYERRGSLVIETARGPVTSAWLPPAERARLLRAVIERARLIRTLDEPPFGVVARYVPRAKDIAFIPHHARQRPDSGDVVS